MSILCQFSQALNFSKVLVGGYCVRNTVYFWFKVERNKLQCTNVYTKERDRKLTGVLVKEAM